MASFLKVLQWNLIGPTSRADEQKYFAWKYPNGHVFDMKKRGWGCNIQRCGERFAMWATPTPSVGDRVITELGEFFISGVERCYDPPDMVFCSFLKTQD